MIDFGYGVKLDTINHNFEDCLRTFRNDYKIWKWCRQFDLISEDNHSDWINSLKSRSDIKMYAIRAGTGYVAGVCGLTDIDRVNQRAEFSLYIFPDYHRKGYGKAALKTLLSHGFLNQNLNVIWGETFEGNPAFEMFTQVGMLWEGTRRKFYYREGKFIDAYLVSITKDQFMGVSWKQAQL